VPITRQELNEELKEVREAL